MKDIIIVLITLVVGLIALTECTSNYRFIPSDRDMSLMQKVGIACASKNLDIDTCHVMCRYYRKDLKDINDIKDYREHTYICMNSYKENLLK